MQKNNGTEEAKCDNILFDALVQYGTADFPFERLGKNENRIMKRRNQREN